MILSMHTHYMTLLFSFLLSFATAVSSDQTGSGCKLATDFLSAATGFVATVYSNTYNFTNYSIPKSYFYYNYKTESEYGVVNGITQPGITIIDFQGYFEGYQQAYYLDGYGYSLQLTGYFVPTESGIHGFQTTVQ